MIKWYLTVDIEFRRTNPDNDEEVSATSYFRSTPVILNDSTQMEAQLSEALNRIKEQIEQYTVNGSGWRIHEILNMTVATVPYDPVGGSSFIETPEWIDNKKATVNIKNTDN